MKLNYLIQQIYYEPSLILPEAHASIRQLLEHRLGDGLAGSAREPGKDFCGDTVEVDQMRIDAGIAYIPIGGAIGKGLDAFDRGSGAVDVADIEDDLSQAAADRKVRGAVLMMDSPGGMVLGTPELATVIGEFPKPIYTFSEGMIASAAYWLASATDGIFTTLTAATGSIGVFVPWMDQTKRYEQAGVKVELIKAGKLKGMGFPGTALTEDQRAHLQERVNMIYGMFTGHVQAHRPKVTSETMQGQTFLAKPAFDRGLIDGIVRGVGEVAALIP